MFKYKVTYKMSDENKIKIVLVDRHYLLFEGLKTLFRSQSDMEIVAVINKANNERAVVQQIQQLKPDVVLIDINTHEMNALEVAREIAKKDSNTKVLALLSFLQKPIIDQAIRMGILGFILKESTFDELICAIRSVREDKLYMCPKITNILADSYVTKLRENHKLDSATFTEREYEIIRLLSQGKSTKKIAMHLNISPKTVDAGRREIMSKLKINSIAELVKYALRTGITGL